VQVQKVNGLPAEATVDRPTDSRYLPVPDTSGPLSASTGSQGTMAIRSRAAAGDEHHPDAPRPEAGPLERGNVAAGFSLGSSAFWMPDRLVESAWLGHIPFAFWLTVAIRPTVFVELGAHTGASYCAFCQAIDSAALGTAAYAVDTWEGDQHAGFYDSSVFDELNQYNAQAYEEFSRLLRCRFDDALHYFNDGEIDLLHIDGLHTYDAVRHDFETWLSKMSRRGVVLLHDINVRERDFGVWRLWGEIAARFPSFSFHHHHGLGVACVGDEPPPELDRLTAAAGDPQAAALWRGSFARLGQGIQARWEAGHHAERAMALGEERDTLHRQLAEERDTLHRQLAEEREALHRRLADGEVANRQLATSLEEIAATATAAMRERDALVAERSVLFREREAIAAELAEALTRCGHIERASRTLSMERDNVQRELERHKRACDTLARELGKHRRRRQKLKNSLLWRATRPVRAAVGTLRRPFKRPKTRRPQVKAEAVVRLGRADIMLADRETANQGVVTPSVEKSYANWVAAYDTLDDRDRAKIKAQISEFPLRPLISVVMPTYNSNPAHLEAAINSVQKQLYPNWELCIADDASTATEVRETLAKFSDDPRVKVFFREVNGHISAASNDALGLAEGEFVALMDHDDLLPEHALYEIALAINKQPDVDLIYTDEDQVDEQAQRSNAYFKPDWDPDLFLVHNLISHLGVYRRSKIESIGGFRLGYEGSQDYDLALRFIRRTPPDRIMHIPAVLYHWRKNRDHSSFSSDLPHRCAVAARRAIAEHLQDRNEHADITPLPKAPLWQRIKYALPEPTPLVTVIIPTRDRCDMLSKCLEGLCQRTDYNKLEILVVDNNSTDPRALAFLATLHSDARIRVLQFPGTFNFSAINNFAAHNASGEILLLLNNDVEVIHQDWLTELVSQACRQEIGAVGAKLIYPNGKVQHAGVVLGVGGVAAHYGDRADRDDPGYFHLLAACRTVSAVTAACLAVRRDLYLDVGGLNEHELKIAFNDVDFCLKLRERGYRNIYTPFAELYHHESVSRGSDLDPDKIERFRREVTYMKRRWGCVLRQDPYYNINFDQSSSNFKLGWPPQRLRTWTGSS
jgi:O-antigen biosynthesis protein